MDEQIVTNPPPPTVPINPNSSKQFKLLTIFLSFILILTLVIVGFLAYRLTSIQQSKNITFTTPIPTLSPTTPPSIPNPIITTTDPQTGWFIITNPKKLYFVSFPADFTVQTINQDNPESIMISNRLPPDPNCHGGGCFLGTSRLNIFFEIFSTTSDLATFAQERYQNSLNTDPNTTKIGNGKFHQLDDYEYSTSGEGYNRIKIVKINHDNGLVISENYPSKQDVSKYQATARQILSTLKFTSSASD